MYEILNITYSTKNNIYFKMGLDNIEALYKNILELLLNDYGLRALVKKIQGSEIEVDIFLDNSLIKDGKHAEF